MPLRDRIYCRSYMAERDGGIELAEILNEGQRQFVRAFVDGVAKIDGVSAVALLRFNPKPALCVIVPCCSGFPGSIVVPEPEVKAEVLDVILKKIPMDGDFGYSIITPVGSRTSAGIARSLGGEMVYLWQRPTE